MEKHRFFFESGFTLSGIETTLYQENTLIQFNCNYLNDKGYKRKVYWTVTKSTTGELVRFFEGETPSQFFTYEEGCDGLDVRMVIDFGYMEAFKKRHRIWIRRGKSNPTRTIYLNQLPLYSGGVVFSNSATASVTGGSAIVTTSAAHGASVDDIIALTQDGVTYTFRAVSGTSGTTITLERAWPGSSGTITNANTKRGTDIRHVLDQSNYSGATTTFNNSATATVVKGSTSVTTSASHGVLPGQKVQLFQNIAWIYTAMSGTSGSTLILDRGWQGANGTIANADTKKGDSIGFSEGEIINLTGDLYTANLFIRNIGAINHTLPIQFSVPDGNAHVTVTKAAAAAGDDALTLLDNINNVHFLFDKDSNGDRKFNTGGISSAHFSIGNVNDFNNIRLFCIQVNNAKSSGVKMKLDSNDRATGALYGLHLVEIYVEGSGNEGFYTMYFDYAYISGDTKYYPAAKKLVSCLNITRNTGWDGQQYACCDDDSDVHDNFSELNGLLGVANQNFGFSVNPGFKGSFYNNICPDNDIQFQVYSDSLVYNNIILGNSQNTVFVRRSDNPMLGTPSYVVNDPNCKLKIFNNTFKCTEDAVYVSEHNDGGSGAIPVKDLWYFNNTILYTGAPIADGELRYGGSGMNVVIKSNFKTQVSAEVGLNAAWALTGSSKVFDDANEGVDTSLYVSLAELKLGAYTDITGQENPDRGYWRRSHIQRPVGFEDTFEKDSVQIAWYRYGSGEHSAREKVPAMRGNVVKRWNSIATSNKPDLIFGIRAYAKTGTIEGPEKLPVLTP